MSCHQAHNIPWSTFLELLHKVPPRHNPSQPVASNDEPSHKLVFTPDAEGRVFRRITHFANKLHNAIKEFSQTERKKYLDDDIDGMTQLYDKGNNDFLREDSQDLSGWSGLKEEHLKSYEAEDYIETVKELFIQEQIAPLLHLSRNGVRLEKLQFATYSNFFHYGVGRIKEDCLTLYIHLNLLLATGTICNPSEWYVQWKQFLRQEILIRYDGNSHIRMYKEYFIKNPNFEDLEGLHDLLKRLFRMLYLYDMVMNERNVNVDWKNEVLRCVFYFAENTSLWYDQVFDG